MSTPTSQRKRANFLTDKKKQPRSVRTPCRGMMYHGIDNCDRCGQPLEDGQWLVGLCRACEQAQKMPKMSVEILEPPKGLVR